MKVKKIIFTAALLIATSFQALNAQSWNEAITTKKAELNVYYFENEPYAFKKGEYSGIEIDILESFVVWLKDKKGVELNLKFKGFKEFQTFYNGTRDGENNTIGLGSVTISTKRIKEVKFSAPYLNNVSVLITDGNVPTSKSEDELYQNVFSMRAITIKGSSHHSYLKEWYKKRDLPPAFEYVTEAEMIPLKIKESAKYIGYVDIISFWKYLKSNDHFIKMHSIANKSDEQFGFIFPKSSDWDVIVNEFFESGFGFTSTKEYHEILVKHLGFEIINKVEINK